MNYVCNDCNGSFFEGRLIKLLDETVLCHSCFDKRRARSIDVG